MNREAWLKRAFGPAKRSWISECLSNIAILLFVGLLILVIDEWLVFYLILFWCLFQEHPGPEFVRKAADVETSLQVPCIRVSET